MDEMQTDHSRLLAILRREPLRNVVLLKFLHANRVDARAHIIERDGAAAVLLVVDNAGNGFDRTAYPGVASSVLVASDEAPLLREALTLLAGGQSYVFKLMGESDRAVVAERFALERRTSFVSYSGLDLTGSRGPAEVLTSVEGMPFALFAEQGHAVDWLRPLVEAGEAFGCLITTAGQAVAACFAFRIDEAVWEIGGVYTLPDVRGRGLGHRVVQAALGELQRRCLVPRYQIAEGNVASIRLAAAVGMVPYLTVTHYLGVAKR